jgi:hypothetical protein
MQAQTMEDGVGQEDRVQLSTRLSRLIVATTDERLVGLRCLIEASGRVVDISLTTTFEFIDRMSRKYTGSDYQRRIPREIFKIAIDRVSSSGEWGR